MTQKQAIGYKEVKDLLPVSVVVILLWQWNWYLLLCIRVAVYQNEEVPTRNSLFQQNKMLQLGKSLRLSKASVVWIHGYMGTGSLFFIVKLAEWKISTTSSYLLAIQVGRLWHSFPLAEICLHMHVIFLGFIFPVLRAEPRDLGLLGKHYTTELNLQH